MVLIWMIHPKYYNHHTMNLPVEDRAIRKEKSQSNQTKVDLKL